MRVLFDNGTPRGVASALSDHTVEEARSHGWDTLGNGELMDAAEAAGFDVLLTTDRNIRYQQSLTGRKIAIVVLGKGRWRLIRKRLPAIAAAVAATTPGSFTEVDIPID
jgi:predicted nuclease of predicted toxin-antitoxin system